MKMTPLMLFAITVFLLFAPVERIVPATSAIQAVDPPPAVLRFGVHVSEMGNLDPHLAAGSQDRALADMVFNGLLRYRPGQAPTIEPDLAERIPGFEMIGGRQVWTVNLRKGVMFHAGPKTSSYELTADDVVFSLRKSAQREFCAYAGEYEGMRVEAIDRYSVRIILDKPTSSILFLPKLTNYAGGFIVSQSSWFMRLKPERGRITHLTPETGKSLAMVDYFSPWQWYILASDPEREVYGVADRMTPYLFGLGIGGFLVMAAALMLLTRRLTDPLQGLTAGAERIGRGDLDTRLAVRSQDEFGRLATVFNQMAATLQETLTELRHREEHFRSLIENSSKCRHVRAYQAGGVDRQRIR